MDATASDTLPYCHAGDVIPRTPDAADLVGAPSYCAASLGAAARDIRATTLSTVAREKLC